MESLRAAYVDEDDNNDNNHTESIMATEAASSPLRRNPQEIPNLSNTNNNDDETESSNDDNNNNDNGNEASDNNNNDNGNEASDNNNNGEPELEDPRQPPTTTSSSEEDASANRTRKKQKPLSAFAPASPPPAPTSATTPAPTTTTQTTTTKKPKKKSNNVWTKSTSRKSKKKSKPTAATSAAQQSAVLITPVPRFPDKSDDSPDASICLSKIYKAEKVELSDDRLSAGSAKGYRMVRATRGVVEGAWYFEIKVVHLGETGHTRLGWATEKGDLQAPVGYDANSFGYRDVDGSKVHRAVREEYGEKGYGEGDVVGCYINLPDGESYAPKPPQLVWYKGQRYAYAADGKDDPPKVVPGSEISFFKNGLCQGVAFTNLFGGQYYPAASMFTRPNQLNCTVKFNFGPDFEFFPEDFGDRPKPRPMIEVPYHGYDGRVEDPPQNGLSSEKKN